MRLGMQPLPARPLLGLLYVLPTMAKIFIHFHSLADIGILAALSFSLAAYRFYDPQVLWKPVCQNLLFSLRRGLSILNLWSGDASP